MFIVHILNSKVVLVIDINVKETAESPPTKFLPVLLHSTHSVQISKVVAKKSTWLVYFFIISFGKLSPSISAPPPQTFPTPISVIMVLRPSIIFSIFFSFSFFVTLQWKYAVVLLILCMCFITKPLLISPYMYHGDQMVIYLVKSDSDKNASFFFV